MIRALRTLAVALFAFLMMAMATVPVRAEVSAQEEPGGRVSSIVMAIVDHIDPVDVHAWLPIRPVEFGSILNPDGFARGDGRPDMGWFANGRPVVVWSMRNGTNLDVVMAEWDAAGWTAPQFVTSTNGIDEHDPRVLVEPNGTAHVVWWEEGVRDTVYMRTRTDSGWMAPVVVTESVESGRRPSLVVHLDELFVAYERDSEIEGMAQDIVVAEKGSDGGITERHLVASTDRTDRLDPMLHSAQEFLWVDWKHGETEFGHAVAEGGSWPDWSVNLWMDPTWIGVEDIRFEIQNEVLP